MSRWIALAMILVGVPAHAASICIEPAARSTLVGMVVNHDIEKTLPQGWTLSHVNAGRSDVSILLQAPDHSQHALMLATNDAEGQPPLIAQASPNDPVLKDVAAVIVGRMPPHAAGPCDEPPPAPHDSGPPPWSRARALFVGALAALSILGTLVFVLIQ